jgi:hypothetical protein
MRTSEKAVHRKFREHPFPDVGKLCVIFPLCTENRLRFSIRLDDGGPEVRFELAVRG